MPTGKGRLPLKKVRINENLRTSLYYKNRSKLGLLPKLFLYFLLGIIISAPLWYFNLLNVQAFFSFDQKNSKNNENSPAALVLKSEKEVSQQIDLNSNQNTAPDDVKNKNTILINNESGLKCYLDYSIDSLDVETIIRKNPEGWWLPSNCNYSKLKAIQILRLTTEEVDKLGKKINPSNIQNLDGNDTYALAYTVNDDTLPYNLERYIKSLTLPVFQDRFYFNTSSAFETKRIGRFTYYLDGNCQGALVNDPCKLWRGDNNTGTIELLKKNVGLTGKGEENELKTGFIVKFATKQDYFEGVSLIFLDQQTGNYKLLRINQTEWKVFESLDIPTTDSLYSVYYL